MAVSDPRIRVFNPSHSVSPPASSIIHQHKRCPPQALPSTSVYPHLANCPALFNFLVLTILPVIPEFLLFPYSTKFLFVPTCVSCR